MDLEEKFKNRGKNILRINVSSKEEFESKIKTVAKENEKLEKFEKVSAVSFLKLVTDITKTLNPNSVRKYNYDLQFLSWIFWTFKKESQECINTFFNLM